MKKISISSVINQSRFIVIFRFTVLVILSVLFSNNIKCQSTIGNTEVFSLTSTTANRRAVPITFNENAEIKSISIYHNGGSGNVLLGVYSDASNSPSSRLGVTSSTVINSTIGWQTIPLTSPVTVTSGQTVWLSWVFQTNPGIRYAVGASSRAQSGEIWPTGMPQTFGTSSFAGYKYSIYCSYTPITANLSIVGNTEVFGLTSTTANRRAVPITFTENAEINSISIYHNGGSGNVLLGVYSDVTNSPSSRLGVTPSTVINSAGGWQTITLTDPVTVTSGQTVWLSWVFQTNPGIRYAVGSPSRAQSGEIWPTGMPHSFGMSSFADYKYSIFCSYTGVTDTTNPSITDFSIPANYPSLSIPINKFSATDNIGVTGFNLSETSVAPKVTDTGWSISAPYSYTFSSEGAKTLFAWVKDEAGNVSNPVSGTVVISLPNMSPTYSEYLFEEPTGVTVLDSHGPNNGTIINNVTRVGGILGSGLEFTGSGYVNLDKSFGENVQNEVTLSAWIKPNSTTGDYKGLIMHGGQNLDTYALYIRPDSKGIAFKTSGTSNAWLAIDNVNKLWDGNWHHVAVTYNGSQKVIYVDNVVLSSVDATGKIELGYGYNLLFGAGRDTESPTLLYNGKMDEVRIYNYALTSTQISDLYNIVIPEPEDVKLGNMTIYGSTSTSAYRRAVPVTFSENGEIKSISIYHNGGTGKVFLGVYADQTGFPSSQLGVTASVVINSSAGWQTISLASPVTVSSGKTVWLSWVFEYNPGIRYIAEGPSRAQTTDVWQEGMPALFGRSTFADYKYSIFCTYTPDTIAPTPIELPETITLDYSQGANRSFNINSNTNWSITNNADWLVVTPTSGVNNETITFTSNSVNTGTTPRMTEISILENGAVLKTLSVIQGYQKIEGNNVVFFEKYTTPNSREASQIQVSEEGEITSISIYHSGGTGKMVLGIYSDENNSPSSRLGLTETVDVNATEGWQTVKLLKPLMVTTGQILWLSWIFENNMEIRRQSDAPMVVQSSESWAAGMPSSYGESNFSHGRISIYCTSNSFGIKTIEVDEGNKNYNYIEYNQLPWFKFKTSYAGDYLIDATTNPSTISSIIVEIFQSDKSTRIASYGKGYRDHNPIVEILNLDANTTYYVKIGLFDNRQVISSYNFGVYSKAPHLLKIDTLPTLASLDKVGESDWYFFKSNPWNVFSVQTYGILNTYMYLIQGKLENWPAVKALQDSGIQDDDSGIESNAKIDSYSGDNGCYEEPGSPYSYVWDVGFFVKVEGKNSGDTGAYSIDVKYLDVGSWPTDISLDFYLGATDSFHIIGNYPTFFYDADWLSVSPTGGWGYPGYCGGNNTIIVQANSVNTGNSTRTATIIMSSDGAPDRSITVVQDYQTNNGNSEVYSTVSMDENQHAMTENVNENGELYSTEGTKSALINSSKIESLESGDLKVYPNPFNDKLFFEFVSGNDADVIIEIYNLTGQAIVKLLDQKVKGGVMNRIEFTPNQMISGIYMYKLTLDENTTIGKVIYKK